MIAKETVYIAYCDGCGKRLIDKHPVLDRPKDFQKSERDAEFAITENNWLVEKVDWRVYHYCPECQNAIMQLKVRGKYNPYDGYTKRVKI